MSAPPVRTIRSEAYAIPDKPYDGEFGHLPRAQILQPNVRVIFE